MDDRFAMANMAIEAGAKNGIFPVDELAIQYIKDHSRENIRFMRQMKMRNMMRFMRLTCQSSNPL
jgi:homoaconitase/3-isopropylmalate dehydratase large subunit